MKKSVRSEWTYRYFLVKDDSTAPALETYGLQIVKGQGGIVTFGLMLILGF